MRGLLSRVQPSALLRNLAPAVPAQSGVASSDRASSKRGLGDALSGLANDINATLSDAASGQLDKATADIVPAVSHFVQNVERPDHDTGNNGGNGGSGGGEGGSGNGGDSGGGAGHTASSYTPPAASPHPSDGSSRPTQGPPPGEPPYETSSLLGSSVPVSGESSATVAPGGGGGAMNAPNPTSSPDADPSAIPAVDPGYHSTPQPATRGGASHSSSRGNVSIETTSTGPPTQSPTNGSKLNTGSGVKHRFPIAAAAAIGAVLGFLVVSAILWGIWFCLRKRRRAARGYPHYSKRVMSLVSDRTVSTVPLFISASEAGVRDESPFKHPRDVDEDDPFDAASLWSASTKRSTSTLSV